MKSKITVLAFALLTSLSVLANSSASLTIVASTESVYNVYYKTAEAGRVKVSIYNSGNKLVFSEMLYNVASFMRPYNFSELSEGEYTVVVEDKNGKQAEKVNYAMNKITSIIKVTEVANASDKFLLNVTTTGTQSVTVKIFDATQTLVYNNEVEVTGSFGVIYNLSQIKSTDNITFEVSTSNGKTETITF
ncbi:MAG TPA: hypothetical protein VGK59_01500 [Ohtaekwangia sp.]